MWTIVYNTKKGARANVTHTANQEKAIKEWIKVVEDRGSKIVRSVKEENEVSFYKMLIGNENNWISKEEKEKLT
jgi:hypothetical protein